MLSVNCDSLAVFPVYSDFLTYQTDSHDIAELFLIMVLNTIAIRNYLPFTNT